jgi:hypothetical protein
MKKSCRTGRISLFVCKSFFRTCIFIIRGDSHVASEFTLTRLHSTSLSFESISSRDERYTVLYKEYPVWYKQYPVLHKEYRVLYKQYPVLHKEYHVWYKRYPVLHKEYPVWYKQYPVWYKQYPVLHKEYTVWYKQYPVWYKLSLVPVLSRQKWN